MATGGEGNEGQMQLGYGSRVWGTGRVMVCPPGPGGATQRSSVEGTVSDQDELHQSRSHGEEDVTQSPPVPGRRGQSGDETEVVIRSQWQQHAPAGEQGQAVTQLAAHSIADGKRSSALMEISVKKEQVQWRSHCRSFGELGCWQHPDDGRPPDFDGRI